MRSLWADSVANAEESAPATGAANGSVANHDNPRPTRSSYVSPHLRGHPASGGFDAQAGSVAPGPGGPFPSAAAQPPAQAAAGGGPRWDGIVNGGGRGGGGGGGAWNSRLGGWDRKDREPDPFAKAEVEEVDFEGDNTGINFDAYEDIPVETSGHDVPAPVNTFAEIDLGDALNLNIRRCKYVKPTPVQRYAIPISIAGRDLMACAQTGSGKTAAFCFPIISGILKSRPPQRLTRSSRIACPLTLILSPTRELSVQIHEEARKFAYQTGVRVVVAY